MAQMQPRSTRIVVAALVGLAQAAQLAWDHLHGGIPAHHLLAREDLPSVSNAWGVLVLPLLAWWLVGRMQRRLGAARAHGDGIARTRTAMQAGFVIAAMVGITLSAAFTLEAQPVASAVFFGTLATALVLPAYRAECVLGFVLAMAWTFGPVLPVLIASVIALVSYVSTTFVIGTVARLVRAKRSQAMGAAG